MSKEGQYGENSWGESVQGTLAFPGNSDLFAHVSPLWCSVDIKEMSLIKDIKEMQLASYFTGITWRAREKLNFIIIYSGGSWGFIEEMYALYCEYESIQSYLSLVLLIDKDASMLSI